MSISSRSMLTAMLCSAAVTAEFVGGKATRDALFLTSLAVTTLPVMLIATSICSFLLVGAQARFAGKASPTVFVPAAFAVSGLLFLLEWVLWSAAPVATAVIVYLHVSGLGPLLASGFWLIASERFDPRTAKKRFGQIAGAGTIGGVFGALMSERMAVLSGAPGMLCVLALLQFAAAWLSRSLAVSAEPVAQPAVGGNWARAAVPATLRSSLRGIASAPHLRHLMTLLLLGTTSAALLEYLFKAEAVETFGRGDSLLRFFGLYYAAISLLSFFLQAFGSRSMLQRFGLGLTTSTPSIALLAGSVGNIIAPGFSSLAVARGGESLFRGSWFRAGYELFFTPLAPAEKRAAKSIIDVGVDRLGDAIGGSLVRVVIVFFPVAMQSNVILALAMAASAGAILAAGPLNRWYVRSLEKSLVNQAGPLDLAETHETGMARVLLSIRRRHPLGHLSLSSATPAPVDHVVNNIVALRSGRRERIVAVLSRRRGIPASLVPHTIPLLLNDEVSDYAIFALRKVAEEQVGQLVDALLDPNQADVVRRRVARVFSVCVSQRAADGLMLALDDKDFAVRAQAAKSLLAILDKNPRIRIDRAEVETLVIRELSPGRAESLPHVFSLLSLILPREPLQIAFRSLQSDDRRLRGTAIEYLEGVVPASISQRLRPYLAARRGLPRRRNGDGDRIAGFVTA